MPRPIAFTVKDTAGNSLAASEILQGAVNIIKEEDIVSQLSAGPSAKPVTDNGVIARYKYRKDFYIGDQEESVIYNALKGGNSVSATEWIKDEILIDVDDSRTTKPKIIRSQDTQMLEDEFSDNANIMLQTMLRRRKVRYAEEKRLKTKANAAITDGITRIVDTSGATTDVAFTKLVQDSIADLVDHFDDIFTKDNVDALGIGAEMLVGSFNQKSLTKMSNTQAFTGGSESQAQLEKGSVGVISQVEMKHFAYGAGIDGAIEVRGAIQMPLANIEKVEDKVGNFTKQWLRWDMPKQGSTHQLFSYVILFGDPAVINA